MYILNEIAATVGYVVIILGTIVYLMGYSVHVYGAGGLGRLFCIW